MAEKKTKKPSPSQIILDFFEELFKEMGFSLFDQIENRAKKITRRIASRAQGSVIMFVGLIFICAGLAIFIGTLTGIGGIGYLLVGLIIAITGLIIYK